MNLENKKQVAIIVLAIGLGLVAATLTGNYIQNNIQAETARLSQEIETKKVQPMMQEIAALRDQMQQLAARQATMATATPGQGGSDVPAPPKSSLALRTPAGKRAYTILMDSLSAVGGLVNPGDYIDVIAHLNIPNPTSEAQTPESISSIVFQNVQILAVGTNLQAPGGYEQQQNARSLNITLALTPEEAGLMAFMEKNGKLQFILRAPAETETEQVKVSSWSTLADYVFEKQGTELVLPREKAIIEPLKQEKKEEVKPFIQIFRGGQQQ